MTTNVAVLWPLNPDAVHRWVAEVAVLRNDPEAAHSEEDRLHVAVLRAIAEGAADGVEMARVALSTAELDFERWFA